MKWCQGPELASLLRCKRVGPIWSSGEAMELYHFVWMLAAVTGLTAAGLAGNGWALVTGRKPSIWMLAEYSVSMPLKVLALITYAPLAVVKSGLSYIDSNPVFAVMVTLTGLFWSFMQGVFILTTFFGYT